MSAPELDYAVERFRQAAALLPYDLRLAAERLPDTVKASTEELRLRVGRPLMTAGAQEEKPVPGCETEPIRPADFGFVLEIASQASAHTVLDRVRGGFVTIRGGHRVGICGSAVVKDGEVYNLRQISSMAVRIAREATGAALPILPQLLEGGTPVSTLILSPPGAGKTTLLRDLIRCISAGAPESGLMRPLRVGVADERGELAAMYDGIPQTDIGPRTDVMDGCPKGPALLMLLRGMNPQVLAADEITAHEDAEALAQAAGCGVTLLATAHGGSLDDLRRRPVYRRLLQRGLFRRVVLIRVEGARRVYQVMDPERGAPLC